MRRGLAIAVVAALVALGIAFPRQPADRYVSSVVHRPVLVVPTPQLSPLVVRSPRLSPTDSIDPAPEGVVVPVQITAYCLRGLTRMGDPVRHGIIAADPRVFPLGRQVDLFVGRTHRGRFLISDTGRAIKGRRIDLWMAGCDDAVRFGRRSGRAVLVAPEAA